MEAQESRCLRRSSQSKPRESTRRKHPANIQRGATKAMGRCTGGTGVGTGEGRAQGGPSAKIESKTEAIDQVEVSGRSTSRRQFGRRVNATKQKQ
ncbi:hypothetical protein SLA2020_494310 [Shorea laevis]